MQRLEIEKVTTHREVCAQNYQIVDNGLTKKTLINNQWWEIIKSGAFELEKIYNKKKKLNANNKKFKIKIHDQSSQKNISWVILAFRLTIHLLQNRLNWSQDQLCISGSQSEKEGL